MTVLEENNTCSRSFIDCFLVLKSQPLEISLPFASCVPDMGYCDYIRGTSKDVPESRYSEPAELVKCSQSEFRKTSN